MKLAVLSGKGGTGKTFVSVNLAAVAGIADYVDCDVEEPNGRLFFKPSDIVREEVAVQIPVVDTLRCTGCKKCVEFCRFNALAYAKELIVFDKICHSCGGCRLVCPVGAIEERPKTVGVVERGISDKVAVHTGILNIGEASGVPILNKLLSAPFGNEVFLDCPPGSACTVMESISDAGFCLLVAEPTLFGAHNLAMVHELVKLFGKPCGAVLNKCGDYKNPSKIYCEENGIKIFAEIPFDLELAQLNSNAQIAVYKSERYRSLFLDILSNVKEAAQ